MDAKEQTAYDRVIRWSKEKPAVVVILILFAVVVGLGSFTSALDRIISFVRNQSSPASSEGIRSSGSDRRFVDLSLEEIGAIYEGRTTLQAEALAREMYLENWVRFRVVLRDVEYVSARVMVEGESPDRELGGPALRAFFDQRWSPQLSHLGNGTALTIQGRITAINRSNVVIVILEDSEPLLNEDEAHRGARKAVTPRTNATSKSLDKGLGKPSTALSHEEAGIAAEAESFSPVTMPEFFEEWYDEATTDLQSDELEQLLLGKRVVWSGEIAAIEPGRDHGVRVVVRPTGDIYGRAYLDFGESWRADLLGREQGQVMRFTCVVRSFVANPFLDGCRILALAPSN